jgi:hypothetical protein
MIFIEKVKKTMALWGSIIRIYASRDYRLIRPLRKTTCGFPLSTWTPSLFKPTVSTLFFPTSPFSFNICSYLCFSSHFLIILCCKIPLLQNKLHFFLIHVGFLSFTNTKAFFIYRLNMEYKALMPNYECLLFGKLSCSDPFKILMFYWLFSGFLSEYCTEYLGWSKYHKYKMQKYMLLTDLDDTLYPLSSGLSKACTKNIEGTAIFIIL